MRIRVRILQVLCGPLRHCIVAIAYEPFQTMAGTYEDFEPLTPETSAPVARKLVQKMLDAKAIDPWCALCREPAALWRYEDMPTRFKTMAEARPELERLQREQMITHEIARMTRRPVG